MNRFVDIGANLLDDMFLGVYREKQLHAGDLLHVLDRAKAVGAQNIICTAGSVLESHRALDLVRTYNQGTGFLKCTVGIHPTQALSVVESTFTELEAICINGMQDGSVVAVGECGLDRDRVGFAPFDIQLQVFEQHFALCERTQLPMFIHSRSCFQDTFNVLERHPNVRGVVHSFDYESLSDANELLQLNTNLYIGLNGCSLKTEGNLLVAAGLPLDRILVESDAPWCGIRGTSAATKFLSTPLFPTVNKPEKLAGKETENLLIKSRNEPCSTLDVLKVLAQVKQLSLNQVSIQILANTHRLFGEMKV
ncbi:hypothetical protein BASA81_010791 [Batrachochytrium salamandrivorans]|nr:hypothetical protein BASA81_010791 [Batrachochytrium salamandrivorans]